LALILVSQAALAQATDYRYVGRGTGMLAKSSTGQSQSWGDTGPLPGKGGDIWSPETSASISGVFQAGTIAGRTIGKDLKAVGIGKVSGLQILPLLGGTVNLLSADNVYSKTIVVAGKPAYGFSQFDGLTIMGSPVTVSGAPNQSMKVNVAGVGAVHIILNYQSVSADGTTMTTSAIRIIFPDSSNLYIAKSLAGMVPLP